jgi:hypothetical protein
LGHQIFIIYTKINLIKICLVEFSGVWWNGINPIPPYTDYNETWWIGLVELLIEWIGLVHLLAL